MFQQNQLNMFLSADGAIENWVQRGENYTDTGASGNSLSSFVDMYNATSNNWTSFPEGLGQARYNLAGASLPSGLVFFAGGITGDPCCLSVFQLQRAQSCCDGAIPSGFLNLCFSVC
jgi:hypothetical protein